MGTALNLAVLGGGERIARLLGKAPMPLPEAQADANHLMEQQHMGLRG